MLHGSLGPREAGRLGQGRWVRCKQDLSRSPLPELSSSPHPLATTTTPGLHTSDPPPQCSPAESIVSTVCALDLPQDREVTEAWGYHRDLELRQQGLSPALALQGSRSVCSHHPGFIHDAIHGNANLRSGLSVVNTCSPGGGGERKEEGEEDPGGRLATRGQWGQGGGLCVVHSCPGGP